MNIIPIKLEEMEKPIILELGFAGENMCTGFSFACDSVFSEYPDAIPSMAVTPPKGSKYPVVVTRDGNNVLWNITDSDTAYMGSGEVQLIFTQNNVVKRSYTCRTRILKSILAEGTPPDPVQSWIDSANEMLAEIPETIDAAIDTAIAAAKASGEFKGDPGFSPVVTTAPITGGNTVTITDEQGEHSFDVLNGANGVSPDLSVTPFTGGHRITIVDVSGTNTFDVTNGVDATPDLITVDYANLTFPVAKGATCYYNGQMFEAKVAIQTAEEWDSTKWEPITVEEQIGSVLNAIQGMNTATVSDVGKALSPKTVSNGKVTEWQFVEGGGSADTQDIKQAITDITGCLIVPMVANKYISLSGSSISMSDGHPAYSEGTTAYSCGYVSCAEGDVFIISGTGGNATRLWGFVDDEGNIISVSEANATETQFDIVAPADAAWFITHTNDGSISYKGDTLELVGELMIHPYEEIINFGQGSIATSDGHIIDSTTRIYTPEYYLFENGLFLTKDKNIKWSLRYYTEQPSIHWGDNEWRTLDGKVTTPYPNVDKYFRIIIAYTDDSTITPSANISVKLWKKASATDKTLTKENKVADAKAVGDQLKALASTPTGSSSMLGNATIRAAKTINFNDGTPPVIDWYLIQSVDSKFYRTKDFVSKEYLFTTRNSGMAGYVSDWSCAVLPNNDVLFVADAAGLSTSTYGRLKDENRINPIIFLASENYARAHTIDFGSNLKPCGWLNNVGFCTLPNGDSVFAEYTRGTVKTANVWLISGDASDPANWSVTWSVNIIDTMDTSTPGTKHCHEVMYDFFTGVLYFGTGDSESGSNNFYSTDNGETWNTLYGNDRNRCRRLNFIFTEDKVYWASDSYQEDSHHFFVAERDINGIVDVENATEINLISGNGQACYGCVYLKSMNLIVMMDRIDVPVTNKLHWYCYDLETETVEKIGEIGSANNTLTALGFRCRFMDFYPVGNEIITGFSPRATSANEDTNQNKLCGNQGGSSGDGSTRINNLLLYVYKNGTDYSYRAKTMWI